MAAWLARVMSVIKETMRPDGASTTVPRASCISEARVSRREKRRKTKKKREREREERETRPHLQPNGIAWNSKAACHAVTRCNANLCRSFSSTRCVLVESFSLSLSLSLSVRSSSSGDTSDIHLSVESISMLLHVKNSLIPESSRQVMSLPEKSHASFWKLASCLNLAFAQTHLDSNCECE